MKLDFKDVTLVSLDTCEDLKSKLNPRIATVSRIVPFLTNSIEFGDFLFINPWNRNSKLIENGGGFTWYNNIIVSKIPYMVKTKYFLVIQWDGFPVHFKQWNDKFFEYDYIGGGHTLQNGGFSLRNTETMIRINESNDILEGGNEDQQISNYMPINVNKSSVNTSFQIKAADEFTANKFSYFLSVPGVDVEGNSFGWHCSNHISEITIGNFFNATKCFSEEEIQNLVRFTMVNRVGTHLFKDGYVEDFLTKYNNDFFNM